MIEAKMIEVRDRGTFMPAVAMRFRPTSEAERYLLSRAGYGRTIKHQESYTMLMFINGGAPLACDYNDSRWNDRTRGTAHRWIAAHFDEIKSGQLVDVEYVLGEVEEPKMSEQFTAPGYE